MSANSSEQTVLRVAAGNTEPVTLHFEAGAPVSVRVEVESNCTCQGAAIRRPGSYTDTDFGAR